MSHIAAAKGAPIWVMILIPLIGVCGTLFGVWLKHWLELRKDRKNLVMGDYFRRSHEVYQHLGTIRRKLKANRALIIRAENGGGIPRPGSQIYISVVFESADSVLEDCRNAFQRYPADGAYLGLLDDVFHRGYVHLVTEDMEEGFLRTYYLSKDIEQNEVLRLYADSDRFVYLSLNYAAPKEGGQSVDIHSAKHRDLIAQARHKLSNIFTETSELTES